MKCFILIVAVIGFVSSLPIEESAQKPTGKNVTIKHGDMIITTQQNKTLFGSRNTKLRNGVKNPSERWPGATVYYQFSPSISK